MRCLSFFINNKIWGGGIMCRHVPKVPYGSYAPATDLPTSSFTSDIE